jgi:anti-sigma regulatory factor (Ser/Thr protein kinase)
VLLQQETGDGVAVCAVAVAHPSSSAAARRRVVPIEHSAHGPAQARRVVAECAARLGFDEQSDDLVLVVSEMVTNAVRHGAPPVRLEVVADEEAVVVAVVDGSARRPVPRDAGDDAEGGRGMTLVDLLTSEHGVDASPPGKTVWARLRRRTAAPAPEAGTS